MSASMAEVLAAMIRKAMLDHRVVWELDPDGETLVARCDSCAYLGSELETFEHQANIAAEQLAANGYGKLEDAWAVVAEELTAKSPRLSSDIRNAVFELVFDVVDKFNFPAQNCGYLKDVVEIGDVCGDVEKRIVALLRARAATERGQG